MPMLPPPSATIRVKTFQYVPNVVHNGEFQQILTVIVAPSYKIELVTSNMDQISPLTFLHQKFPSIQNHQPMGNCVPASLHLEVGCQKLKCKMMYSITPRP